MKRISLILKAAEREQGNKKVDDSVDAVRRACEGMENDTNEMV